MRDYTHLTGEVAIATSYEDFIRALTDHLTEPSNERLQTVLELAQTSDSLQKQYFGGQRGKYAEDLEARTRRLLDGEEFEWAKILFHDRGKGDCDYEAGTFRRLLELSPFSDSSLLAAEHGVGFVTVHGNFLYRLLRRKGHENPNCKNFIIVVPDELLDQIEVVWVNPKDE